MSVDAVWAGHGTPRSTKRDAHRGRVTARNGASAKKAVPMLPKSHNPDKPEPRLR